MLSPRTSFVFLASLLLVACHRQLSQDERKLIGTWETGTFDSVWRVTFKPNHTIIVVFKDFSIEPRYEPEIPGSWQLTGAELTTELDFAAIIPDIKPPRKRMTESITFVGSDRIDRTGGYAYERVK